jgi:methylase of polypeptide subunit release factors
VAAIGADLTQYSTDNAAADIDDVRAAALAGYRARRDSSRVVEVVMHRDNVFGGSVAEVYETLMVPMLFEPYAMDVVRRLSALRPGRVLEIGAGTGVVTRAMAAGLPPETTILATDLNPAMLERAAAAATARDVEWRQALGA